MKTETVKENATFFEKSFREDVERISKLSSDKVVKLHEFITAFEGLLSRKGRKPDDRSLLKLLVTDAWCVGRQ